MSARFEFKTIFISPKKRSMPKMSSTIPYQPLLLRIYHGVSSLLAIGALATGFLVYNTYDRRFGFLNLAQLNDIQGLHGTFGLFFWLVFPLLAIYSFHWGRKRLLAANCWLKFTRQVGKPIWWVNLQRLANTLMLLAATFSVISGRMMQEAWLPAGEFHHLWYTLHLVAFLIFLLFLIVHITMSLKVGGIPLILSMIQYTYRPNDSPSHWLQNVRQYFRK